MRNYYPARWNIHAIAESTDIVNRTKNALERFNRDLNESFTTAHPNLLVFMAVIKEKSKNYVVMLDDIRHHRQRAPEHVPGVVPSPPELSSYRESTDFDYRSLGNNIDDGPDNFEWNCDQQPPPSAASSSNTATSSGEYDNSAPATTPSLRSESPTTSSSVGEEEDSLQTSLSSSASSSNTPTAVSSETGQQEELPTAQASNNTTSREHATIKSMPEGCVVGDPDTYISPKDLLWV
ncbi:hypothetical protein Pcac1_g4407 [Phytophthora cactorum]|nr:hypothetical protein Pcac1_g4407 [Phytophthora cactorum]KAG2894233.1 hypothetical protein PC114_g15984 [Phytophthora cactorum]KAG3003065.1 hypothetical protein PC119_g16139 [Phytophthora cactorum]